MPAVSEQPPELPHTWRPFGARVAGVVFGVMLIAVCVFAWFSLDAPTRARIWQLYRTTPPPLGYDPGGFWPGGPDNPAFGLLRLSPSRIDITGLASSPAPKLTWRPGG